MVAQPEVTATVNRANAQIEVTQWSHRGAFYPIGEVIPGLAMNAIYPASSVCTPPTHSIARTLTGPHSIETILVPNHTRPMPSLRIWSLTTAKGGVWLLPGRRPVAGAVPGGAAHDWHERGDGMSKSNGGRVPAPTFLVHHFGRGLVDEGRTYAVERYRALVDGDIRRWPLEAGKHGRGRPKPEVATYEEVRDLRPAYNEIVVCTALGTSSGVQLYGYAACSFSGERRQRR